MHFLTYFRIGLGFALRFETTVLQSYIYESKRLPDCGMTPSLIDTFESYR